MIWSPHDIAVNALANCDATFYRTSSTTTLTDCDGIPAGTLLLTGTPEGVMFHVVSLWSASAYLEPGDEVITSGTYLGLLHNTVQ